MSPAREIEIAGGGLAGLALGLGLRRAGVAVTVLEAGHYPRHRVCGEFIAGLGEGTATRLGLAPLLADAARLREVAWFLPGGTTRRHRLPAPALALSRHELDARLAGAFTAAGGRLVTGVRIADTDAPAGRVFAVGRRRVSDTPWLGLKQHLLGLPLASELELHLGAGAYVGLCPVEGGRVNVCGLFRRRPGLSARPADLLGAYLRAAGLGALAARLAAAEAGAGSHTAVAGLGYGGRARAPAGRLCVGDAWATIPPFTGHGMVMAFQGAETVLAPLTAWARGETAWPVVVRAADAALRRRFARRLGVAGALHPWLLQAPRQRLLALGARLGVLPLGALQRLLHGA